MPRPKNPGIIPVTPKKQKPAKQSSKTLKPHKPGKRVQKKAEEAQDLYSKGMSVVEISKKLSVHPRTVYDYLALNLQEDYALKSHITNELLRLQHTNKLATDLSDRLLNHFLNMTEAELSEAATTPQRISLLNAAIMARGITFDKAAIMKGKGSGSILNHFQSIQRSVTRHRDGSVTETVTQTMASDGADNEPETPVNEIEGSIEDEDTN